jgi:hypothetical protein
MVRTLGCLYLRHVREGICFRGLSAWRDRNLCIKDHIIKGHIFIWIILSAISLGVAIGQSIRVNPSSANINTQDGTVAFLTFGPLGSYVPADACWCGELRQAGFDLGLMCEEASIFGCLPSRFDQSVRSGIGGFTDIMSLPPSVARRAYQAAADGAASSFFYVRHFISPSGQPDQYVAVTCRLSGIGARTPFSFNSVTVSFSSDESVALVRPNAKLSPIKAVINYNGTGRLMGRWEVVLPGDELPADEDLLTGATLPAEARTLQRRYMQIGTFNIFLPPTGHYTLPGPDPSRIPTKIPGQYFILLRVECTDDKENDSDLASLGVGPGIIHAGAVAAFPMPTLRYFVGSDVQRHPGMASFVPEDQSVILTRPAIFAWPVLSPRARLYRLEIQRLSGDQILAAIVLPELCLYRAPPLLEVKAGNEVLRWRVVGLDANGGQLVVSEWRTVRLAIP